MDKIKAIIFDIDGVLIDSLKSNEEFYKRLFRTLDVPYNKKEYLKVHHLPMWHVIKYFSGERSRKKLEPMFELAKTIRYPYEYLKIPMDAQTVVYKLSKKYKIGVVTARVKIGVIRVFKRYGFTKYIDDIVSFEDYKNHKPHPEPLLKSLKRLKVKPFEAVYVGDMRSDILCARAAGVKSIFYKRHYSDLKNEKPDYTVTTFKQLLNIIDAR